MQSNGYVPPFSAASIFRVEEDGNSRVFESFGTLSVVPRVIRYPEDGNLQAGMDFKFVFKLSPSPSSDL